jgi:hypothetical protein
MARIAEHLRSIAALGRGPIGWTVGAAAVAAIAALLWFGLASDSGDLSTEMVTPASSVGDILPPPEEDADHASQGASEAPTQDVIPPDEP